MAGPAAGGRRGGRTGPTAVLVLVLALTSCGGPRSGPPAAPSAFPSEPGLLALPARPPGAPTGSRIADEVAGLDLEAREGRLYAEIEAGNVPGWLRTLSPVDLRREAGGSVRHVRFWVTPDYLAVGSDTDYFRVPLSPGTAQRVADLVGGALPTPSMVDGIWAAAEVRFIPAPIPPGLEMTTVPVFREHDALVRAQRRRWGGVPGALTAGHKKDVVLTARLDTLDGRVAIYGWHRSDGTPIQPLYTGHTDDWVDYSHGIRIVHRTVLVDGAPRDLAELLRDPQWAAAVSDEGAIRRPRYPRPQRPPDAALHRTR